MMMVTAQAFRLQLQQFCLQQVANTDAVSFSSPNSITSYRMCSGRSPHHAPRPC